jgi:phytanoyl-CoA hydroxylase
MARGSQLRPHPWNTDFTWIDHPGPFQVVTEHQARQYDELGFFVLDDVFSAGEISTIRDEIDEQERRVESFLRKQDGERFDIAEAGAITFTINLALRSPTLASFATQPFFGRLCADLVGPDADLYWDQAVYKKPEKPRRFPWHQDNAVTFLHPQRYLTCWVALTDATIENGCPQVAPGLHRDGTFEHTWVDPLGWECMSDPAEVVAAPVRAGGIVVFSSLTPHLTGPNTTNQVRKAYILQYCPTGSAILQGTPSDGPPTGAEPCDDPSRWLPVTRGGLPVASA